MHAWAERASGLRTIKTVVMGLLQREGTVHAQVAESSKTEALMSVIRAPGSEIMSDALGSYSGLGDAGTTSRHRRSHLQLRCELRVEEVMNRNVELVGEPLQ